MHADVMSPKQQNASAFRSDLFIRFPECACELRFTADAINHVVGIRHDIERAVGPLLDRWRDPESLTNDERFTFGAVELLRPEHVIRDVIGETWIRADIDMQPIRRELETIQTAARSADLPKAARGTDPQRAVVFRSQCRALHERRARRTDF